MSVLLKLLFATTKKPLGSLSLSVLLKVLFAKTSGISHLHCHEYQVEFEITDFSHLLIHPDDDYSDHDHIEVKSCHDHYYLVDHVEYDDDRYHDENRLILII